MIILKYFVQQLCSLFAQEGEKMIFKIIALVIITLLLVLDYALVVIAHEADERAEEMYRRWKSERSDSEADK